MLFYLLQFKKMQEDHKGTIFIVDISGYSGFVENTDNESGGLIIRSLLAAIINVNELALHISEIEGDAILFYRHGPPPAVRAVLSQFEAMLAAFRERQQTFNAAFPQIEPLSIKLIVHYGVLGGFSLARYSKLFGQAVVEAHRLLKNSIGSPTYVLMTKAYLEEQGGEPAIAISGSTAACDIYDIGPLYYNYFTYPFERLPAPAITAKLPDHAIRT